MYVFDSWEVELAFYLRLFANFVLMYTMAKRIKSEHAITGKYSKIKLAYFLIFAGDFVAGITDNLLYKIGLFPYSWQVSSVTRLGADTFMMGLLVVFGLSLWLGCLLPHHGQGRPLHMVRVGRIHDQRDICTYNRLQAQR
jgi:hypothetical protein